MFLLFLCYKIRLGGWLDASRHALMWQGDVVSEFISDTLMGQRDAVSEFILWASTMLCSQNDGVPGNTTIWPLLNTESPVAQW